MANQIRLPPGDRDEAGRLREVLGALRTGADALRGLPDDDHLDVLVAHLIESQRRTRYIERVMHMPLSPAALDGASGGFDPLKGAMLKLRAGDHDEACWLVLLSVHFGRHRRAGWQLVGDFYTRLCDGERWDWPSTSADVIAMRGWLDVNFSDLRSRGGRFGNHRKYESLNAWDPTGTGHVLATYVDWVGGGSHADRFADIGPPTMTAQQRFAVVYSSLDPVGRFGRTARFDFLNMLGKLGLVDVEADSAHLSGATGPLAGARLLLDGSRASASRAAALEARLAPVQRALGVPFDVIEDALCNWQKSPVDFVPFRG